jgi:hypothetical protein
VIPERILKIFIMKKLFSYKQWVKYERYPFLQFTGTKTKCKLLELFQKDGRSFSNAKCELKEPRQPIAVQNGHAYTGMRYCIVSITVPMVQTPVPIYQTTISHNL